ncbi:MAG: hypothetical protein J6G98_02800 [Bacilli bacterium]|nr:hypothetical protein [Bacilli bacterium]
MKKKDKKLDLKLKILKQTRSRDIMPRPTVFEDKTKYKRSRQKVLNRNMINND